MLKAIMVSAACFILLLDNKAGAQTGENYKIPGMNFDMWCQEQAHLPPERCDKRTAEDEKTFESFRNKVDEYEIPYLQKQQDELAVQRDIMQSDPIDNPVGQDPDAQAQNPDRQPSKPLP